jgi:hypothetical protein
MLHGQIHGCAVAIEIHRRTAFLRVIGPSEVARRLAVQLG